MRIESDAVLLSNREIAGFLKKTCKKGVSFKFTAKGMSMSPFICDGDSLIIQPFIKNAPAAGDIVAYISPGNGHLIIHRIIGEKREQYLLKGDNVYTCDGYCKKNDVYGFVKKIIPVKKSFRGPGQFLRKIFLFFNTFKKTMALFSRYKVLTPVCRLSNKLLL